MIGRRCPWTDAAVWRGSLCGTGVAQFQNRVYIAPPGWNPALPPGAVEPFDPSALVLASGMDFHTLDYVDVPAPDDTDPVVALLPSPNPLLVLKRESAYGIYGSFPSFSAELLPNGAGAGCIDLRSAISVEEGAFWVGENGVYWYRGGQIVEITSRAINREWRALMAEGISYVTTGIAFGHLVVSVLTLAGTSRTYLYRLPTGRGDTGAWISRLTNLSPRFMFTARVSGEIERLLAVQDASQGRVIDIRPALAGVSPNATFTQATTVAAAVDGNATRPVFNFTTGAGLAGVDGIEGEQKVLDISVSAKVQDSGAVGATLIQPSLTSQGGLRSPGAVQRFMPGIQSITANEVRRSQSKPNAVGRQHSVTVTETQTSTTLQKLEVPQIVLEVRDARRGT
jgi:hypothetical protein